MTVVGLLFFGSLRWEQRSLLGMQKIVVSVLLQAMNHISDNRSINPEDFGDLLRGVALAHEFD